MKDAESFIAILMISLILIFVSYSLTDVQGTKIIRKGIASTELSK